MSQPALTPEEQAQQERALSRVGTILVDKWHLDALLGVGGMAAVYAATHHNGRRVAIKILHGELAHVVEARERFLEEAYAANRVNHPNTVPVLDDGTTADGCAFLVMDLLEGETLENRLQRSGGALSELEVLSLMDALLDVLAVAHEKGMVHRDIKPENVFLTSTGVVKLLDFGIARLPDSRRTLRTQTGATMGTPAFMSPEQARGRWEELDGRSDLWSVGATMFVLLTGQLVHDAETTNEQLLAAMTQPARPLRSVVPRVPEPVAEIVDRALAFVPADRFENARAMRAAVGQVYVQLADANLAEGRISTLPVAGGPIDPPYTSGGTGQSTYRPVTSTERSFKARLRPWPIAVGCAVLAIFIALAWRNHEDREAHGDVLAHDATLVAAPYPEDVSRPVTPPSPELAKPLPSESSEELGTEGEGHVSEASPAQAQPVPAPSVTPSGVAKVRKPFGGAIERPPARAVSATPTHRSTEASSSVSSAVVSPRPDASAETALPLPPGSVSQPAGDPLSRRR